jgi:hypothetical protein
MARADRVPVRCRIVIEQPVAGVCHSLQKGDTDPLDPKTSQDGEPLIFDFAICVAPGPKFFGDQVRREGPVRRFVYIRIGTLAGDHLSPWTRRMKIDIHDLPQSLLDQAMQSGAVIETVVNGTGKDGTPACATVKPIARRIADA